MVSELARVRCELHPFAEIAVVAKLFDDNVDDTMNHVYDDEDCGGVGEENSNFTF